jgi:hypothetical protein
MSGVLGPGAIRHRVVQLAQFSYLVSCEAVVQVIPARSLSQLPVRGEYLEYLQLPFLLIETGDGAGEIQVFGLLVLGRGDPGPGGQQVLDLAWVQVSQGAEYRLDDFGADRGLIGAWIVLGHGRHRSAVLPEDAQLPGHTFGSAHRTG